MTNSITDTIILARFSDGRVREIKASIWLGTANVIDKPLTHVTWDDDFKIKYLESVTKVDPMDIVACVCEYFQMDFDKLQGRSRKREVVLARHMAIYLIRKYTVLSHKEIGMIFGGRDHSTSIASANVMLDRIELDEAVNKAYQDICRNCMNTLDIGTTDTKKAVSGSFGQPIAIMAAQA